MSSSPLFPSLHSLVDTLETTKALYFAPDRASRLASLSAAALEAATLATPPAGSPPLEGAARAELSLLHGRALDASSDAHSPAAEALLSAAVKLAPGAPTAWKALGHCL